MKFFEVSYMTVRVEPISAAHATIFWFLTGINPARLIVSCSGNVEWNLPAPIPPFISGKATFKRGGGFFKKVTA